MKNNKFNIIFNRNLINIDKIDKERFNDTNFD